MAPGLTPDLPVAFGYKQMWLAVRDADPYAVAAAVGLKDVTDSTWKGGIERAYVKGYGRGWLEVFVSPPVLGWTLAVGGISSLPAPNMPEWLPWVRDLSARLGHVQSFGNHRVSSAVFWAKADRGRIERAYAYADGSTGVNEGEPTPEEVALDFDFLDESRATPAEVAAHEAKVDAELARMEALQTEVETLGDEAEARGEPFDEGILDWERVTSKYDLLIPGEDSVMLLASRWSLDPMRLEEYGIGPGLGLIGKLSMR